MNNETFDHITTEPLISPASLHAEMPMSKKSLQTIHQSRSQIRDIIEGNDKRLLIISGPCSIHDPVAALDYARRLQKLSMSFNHAFHIIMRVYFEKPRTSTGWKGLINDPHMDESYDIEHGLRTARKLLIDITEMGLGTGTELLDPLISPYISDLISYSAIGARTTESQIHRQMASGLAMPVGFKNSTDGTFDSAVNAILSSKTPHSFVGVDDYGRFCKIRTTGNKSGHIILRGGKSGPNYDVLNLSKAEHLLQSNHLDTAIIVDCSHMNAGKKHQNQSIVLDETISNYINGYSCIRGLMIESNICEGSQVAHKGGRNLRYGVSITDECMGWETTESLLVQAAHTVGALNTRKIVVG